MSDPIIVALIAGGVSMFGTIVTVLVTNHKTIAAMDKKSELSDEKLDAKLEKHQAVTDTKIDELTRKVEKHNNLIERTYKLEGEMAEVQHEIRDLKDGAH